MDLGFVRFLWGWDWKEKEQGTQSVKNVAFIPPNMV